MTKRHEPTRVPRRIAEPVQVYLDAPDRNRLERLSDQLGATKSDVLRRALEVLEHNLSNQRAQPSEQIIAIGAEALPSSDPGYDVAREHDRFLAEHESKDWARGQRHAKPRHPAKRRGR